MKISNIIPYKNRTLNINEKVYVYRNLVKNGVWYSIKQNGFVIGHSQNLVLKDVTFKVSEKINQRIKETKERSVHAFAVGFYTFLKKLRFDENFSQNKIFYNPYEYKGFTTDEKERIDSVNFLQLNENGLVGFIDNSLIKNH